MSASDRLEREQQVIDAERQIARDRYRKLVIAQGKNPLPEREEIELSKLIKKLDLTVAQARDDEEVSAELAGLETIFAGLAAAKETEAAMIAEWRSVDAKAREIIAECDGKIASAAAKANAATESRKTIEGHGRRLGELREKHWRLLGNASPETKKQNHMICWAGEPPLPQNAGNHLKVLGLLTGRIGPSDIGGVNLAWLESLNIVLGDGQSEAEKAELFMLAKKILASRQSGKAVIALTDDRRVAGPGFLYVGPGMSTLDNTLEKTEFIALPGSDPEAFDRLQQTYIKEWKKTHKVVGV